MVKKFLPLSIVIFILLLDQFVKFWVKTGYSLGENIYDFGLLRLDFVENPGMAFGLSIGGYWSKCVLSLFRVGAVFLLAIYVIRLIKTNANTFFICLVAMIFAGALGNILDNLFYGILFSESGPFTVAEFLPKKGGYAPFLMGNVVDMLHLYIKWPEWMPFDAPLGGNEVFPPVFNVADASISCSVFIIILFYKKIVRKEDVDFQWLKKQKG